MANGLCVRVSSALPGAEKEGERTSDDLRDEGRLDLDCEM